jgi:hypothetical protein
MVGMKSSTSGDARGTAVRRPRRAKGQPLAVLEAAQRALPSGTSKGARCLLAIYWFLALRFGEPILGRHQTFAELLGSSERTQERWASELIKAGALVSHQTPRGRRVEMAPGWKGWAPTVAVGAANSGGPKSPTRTKRADAECVARSGSGPNLSSTDAKDIFEALMSDEPRLVAAAKRDLVKHGVTVEALERLASGALDAGAAR